MTYQANQSEEAQALLPRIDAAIKRIVNGQGCMRIPADLEDPDLVLADCKKLLKALAALPPQAKAEPAPDIVPTGWLRWQDDEWTYEHNTVYQVKGAPKNTVVRIALYATPVAKAEPAGVSDEAEFELHCDGGYAASTSGPRSRAWADIQHYAAQYQQDGAVVIYEITRKELDAEGRAILSAEVLPAPLGVLGTDGGQHG